MSHDPIEVTSIEDRYANVYVPEVGSGGRGLLVKVGSLAPVMVDRD